MWFKNVRLFQLTSPIAYDAEALAEQLKAFAFTPCLPSFAESLGWISPFDEEGAPLVYAANGYLVLCLQQEEKLLPATIIRQELDNKVKKIEAEEDRKVYRKEKQNLKDELIYSLRPRAFSRFSKIFAYIDTKRNLLVINLCSNNKIEKFITFLKRSLPDLSLVLPTVRKPSSEMTYWLKNKNVPGAFVIEKSCVLQDPNQQNRVIRCQQQNLYAESIQNLLKDGCEVKQLGLSWNDDVNFTLADDFTLRNIRFQDEVLAAAKDDYTETAAQQFDADFTLMSETFSGLFAELLDYFVKTENTKSAEPETAS